jgi:glycosyltransferase involved in cell wall biosynthesis
MDTITNMDVTVGVIIPTFERPHDTNRAVDSVIAQSYKVQHIVVVDDGSSQQSFDLLKSLLYAKDVELLRIDATNHPGIARKNGIEKLKTDWVAFLDSDDSWHPDKIKIQLELAKNHNLSAVCSNANVFNPNTGKTLSSNLGNGYISRSKLLKSNRIINSSVLVHREVLEKSGGIEFRYSMRGAEDYVTWLKISEHTDWFISESNLLTYRNDAKNSVRKTIGIKEIDSHIQGLIGYLYSGVRKPKKYRALRFILRILARKKIT